MAKKKKQVSKEVSDLIAVVTEEVKELLGSDSPTAEVALELPSKKEKFFLGFCPVTGEELFS